MALKKYLQLPFLGALNIKCLAFVCSIQKQISLAFWNYTIEGLFEYILAIMTHEV